ncbi:MAG: aminopeptidase [Chromatiaceae bacterium]|nr:aminopeptidase [Chromatiaceae bacterium]
MSFKVSRRRSFSRSDVGSDARAMLAVAALLLSGCSTVGYYTQTVGGHFALMAATRPVAEVIADPATSPGVRERLRQLASLRTFASDELGLPDNGSYRAYAELQGEVMVWSLVAAPAFSLQPRQWCYPVVGCASYRGYFDRADADELAAELVADGWDVAVEPVPAYSTLGWFDDPVPSTVINWPLDAFAGLLFHELAHQQLYVAGDSAFNEAYATVVEHEGIRRWLERYGTRQLRDQHRRNAAGRRQFLALIAMARRRLEVVYASDLNELRRSAEKQAVFASLRDDYHQVSGVPGDHPRYDRWFDRPLNNAHLASVATYSEWEPALRALLDRCDGDMSAFHAACRELAGLSNEARRDGLRMLSADAPLAAD